MPINRRTFLGASAALAVASWSRPACADELGPGQYPLGIEHDRDGVLYLPKGYRPGVAAPMMVMFHGAGGTGRATSYAFPMADEHGLIILAPDSRDERSWDLMVGTYGTDAAFLSTAMGQTFARCSVDRSRLVIGGHSDGASYALSFGIGAGDVFSQILAFSPGVLTPVAVQGKPRIFISHGIHDEVMPIDDTSRKFVPRLRGLGYEVAYREYDGQHAVPTDIVRAGFDWLAL